VASETSSPANERRQRDDLRTIYDDVLARVEPFFQNGEAHDFWALQAVREAYPSLDEQGLSLVVTAAIRVCRVRGQLGR
jgi:hypothetical protein